MQSCTNRINLKLCSTVVKREKGAVHTKHLFSASKKKQKKIAASITRRLLLGMSSRDEREQ